MYAYDGQGNVGIETRSFNVVAPTVSAARTSARASPPPRRRTRRRQRRDVHRRRNAVDGNFTTRWATDWTDPQWIQVDLGAVTAIHHVQLAWESAYGKAYQIQTSNDGTNWTTVYSTTTGDGGFDDIDAERVRPVCADERHRAWQRRSAIRSTSSASTARHRIQPAGRGGHRPVRRHGLRAAATPATRDCTSAHRSGSALRHAINASMSSAIPAVPRILRRWNTSPAPPASPGRPCPGSSTASATSIRRSPQSCSGPSTETGYVPNRAARSLVTGRTYSVALVVSADDPRFDDPFLGRGFDDPFFGRIASGALGHLGEHGRPHGADAGQQLGVPRPAAEPICGRATSTASCSSRCTRRTRCPGCSSEAGVAAVLFARPATPLPISYVDVAPQAGAALAADHLVARGCGAIVDDQRAARTRPAAQTAWPASGTRWRATAGRSCRPSRATSPRRAARPRCCGCWPTCRRLDGVFAANDLMAQGAVLRAARPRPAGARTTSPSSASTTAGPRWRAGPR